MPKQTKPKTGIAKKRGRTSLYMPTNDAYAEQVAIAGATIPELATAFGVCVTTIETWMRTHSSFAEAIKKGRWQYDTKFIESGLRKRANGFTYEEVTIEAIVILDGDEEDMFIEQNVTTEYVNKKTKRKQYRNSKKLIPGYKRKVVTKTVIPDVAAIIFWLCNRQSGDWQQTIRNINEGTTKHLHQHELDITQHLDRKQLEQLSDIIDAAKSLQSGADQGNESPRIGSSGQRRISS